jgi:hypothetical protein
MSITVRGGKKDKIHVKVLKNYKSQREIVLSQTTERPSPSVFYQLVYNADLKRKLDSAILFIRVNKLCGSYQLWEQQEKQTPSSHSEAASLISHCKSRRATL